MSWLLRVGAVLGRRANPPRTGCTATRKAIYALPSDGIVFWSPSAGIVSSACFSSTPRNDRCCADANANAGPAILKPKLGMVTAGRPVIPAALQVPLQLNNRTVNPLTAAALPTAVPLHKHWSSNEKENIYTLPNALTLSRLLMTPGCWPSHSS